MDDHNFPSMTSYSQNSQKSGHSADLHSTTPIDPRVRYPSNQLPPHSGNPIPDMLTSSRDYASLSSFQQDSYPNESAPSMLTNMPRYPESSQRTLHRHHNPQLSTYNYNSASAYGGLSGSMHTNSAVNSSDEQQTPQRYPSIATNTYPSDLQHTPLSMNLGHSSTLEHTLPSMGGTRLPSSTVINYRQSMTGYHQRESDTLVQQQQQHPLQRQLSHDSHGQDHLQGPGIYSHSPSVADIASRRGSVAPESYQDSHSHSQQQQHLAPLAYDTASSASVGQYPGGSSSSGAHSQASNAKPLMHSVGSYSTSHASTSIPMSNNPPRHLYPTHDHPHNIHPSNPLRHSRTQQHQHPQQHQHRHPHARNANIGLGASSRHAPPSSAYRSHPDDLKSISDVPQLTSAPNLRLERPHSNPRTRSTPDPTTTSHLLRSSTSMSISAIPAHSTSPMGTSDNESTVGSEDDRGIDWGGRGGERGEGGSGRGLEVGIGEGGSGAGEGSGEMIKKKKKSKMHECEVCGKKFPRPSGLKTHMNMHSNEKPYACGFPGCTRTFGVRSNAKRHLRTHGVIPSAATSGPVETPYVVDFSTPMILPPHPQGMSLPGAGMGGDGRPQSELHSVDDQNSSADGSEELGGIVAHDLGQQTQYPASRVPAFKLRWMPLSLTSRTNAAALHEVQDAQFSQNLDDNDAQGSWGLSRGAWGGGAQQDIKDENRAGRDRNSGNDMDIDEGDLEEEEVYGDTALAARLSIPLRPVLPSPSASSSTATSHGDDHGAPHSGRGSSSLTSTALPCMCTPPCPPNSAGSSRCRASSSTNLASLSPASSSTSFTSPAPSASLSPPSTSSRPYSNRAPSRNTDIDFQEERNSYMTTGSHPYHPSQFRGVLPGPAIANADLDAAPRPYMVV